MISVSFLLAESGPLFVELLMNFEVMGIRIFLTTFFISSSTTFTLKATKRDIQS